MRIDANKDRESWEKLVEVDSKVKEIGNKKYLLQFLGRHGEVLQYGSEIKFIDKTREITPCPEGLK